MATFQDVREYVSRNYKIITDQSDDIALEVRLPGERTQIVHLKRMKVRGGTEYLRLLSLIAPAEKVDPKSCMRFNATFYGGHLALLDQDGKGML